MRIYIVLIIIYFFFLIGLCLNLTEVIAQENGSSPVVAIEWLYSEPSSVAVIPISFAQGFVDNQNGGPDDITAISFAIDYDQSKLIFDSTDGNDDGIPDSITFNVPVSFTAGVILTGNPDGEISISIVDFYLPLSLLPSTDDIVKIEFELMDEVRYPISICPVNASFSDILASSILGEEICGGIACVNDLDCDYIEDEEDNCPDTPNGPDGGTCTSGSIGENCMSNDDCGTGGLCSMVQEDTLPPGGNNCGDACECEGDFEPDGDVDGTDAVKFKLDFWRKDCSANHPCNGDFECDGDVDGTDILKFKGDFRRKDCPSCGGWPCFSNDPKNDVDGDNVYDNIDNCPETSNPNQEDTLPPGGNSDPAKGFYCGNACECEGDFEPDGDVDGTDAVAFKQDFFREDCAKLDPCNGDFECDGDVDGTDAVKFKADFFRKDCPSCIFSCF